MADRRILFSGPMVRALIDGRKTQTRRILNPQPFASGYYDGEVEINVIPANAQWPKVFRFNADAVGGGAIIEEIFEPRFNAGDRLWVKETWRTESRAYDDLAPSEMGGEETILYDADAAWSDNKTVGKTRVSIHMPRWASRLTLIVTDVKVERLQDISEEDAIAEGLVEIRPGFWWYTAEHRNAPGSASPVTAYSCLWEAINGLGSWDAKPVGLRGVLALHFKKHRQPGRFRMNARIDLSGKRFGRWKVISFGGGSKWLCRCDCGKEKLVDGSSLRHGRSSGCVTCHVSSGLRTTHGGKHTRLYNIWCKMISRCGNPRDAAYGRYGGRGIRVCNEWRADFAMFRDWALSNGYADSLTIDRENNDGNYEPRNCRWATYAEQNRNYGRNRPIYYQGKYVLIADLAAEHGLPQDIVKNRIRRYGWPIDVALSTPVLPKGHRRLIKQNIDRIPA